MIRAALRPTRAAIATAASSASAPSATSLQGKRCARGASAKTGCGSGSRSHVEEVGGATGRESAGRGATKGAGVAASGDVTTGSCGCVLVRGLAGSCGSGSKAGRSVVSGSAGVGRTGAGRGSLGATGSAIRAGGAAIGVVGTGGGGAGWTAGAGG